MKKFLFVLALLSNVHFAQQQTYVLLISFDGFRWDYPNRGITPHIEKMAKDGVSALSLRPVFPSKTFPNHLSIITGLYAENHGIISNEFLNPVTNEEYRIGNSESVKESKWYLGEAFWETAERYGITAASMFWPGSEINIDHRRPTYVMKYDHNFPYKKRVDQVVDWLELPYSERPHFLTLYFHDTDSYGHKYGPDSPEINQSIVRLDSIIGYLNSELVKINMVDSLNIILVSDHGMTEINREKVINLDSLFSGLKYQSTVTKPFALIYPSAEEFDAIINILNTNRAHWSFYVKDNIPEYFHYTNHPSISPILLVADPGWSLVTNKFFENDRSDYNRGNHGYDNNFIDMHGIFFADGPVFKDGYKTGTLWNVDIYPLMCKIFGITPSDNIDGKLERIEFILK